jgi:glycosyltransferase involved in cell wall biosynthesis
MDTPRFSVILCVLNEEDKIRSSIDCLLKTCPDELIVVDGGSEDRTIEILKNYETLTIIHAPGLGLLRQRLIGIKAARNEVIILVNIDQFPEPEVFELATRELASKRELDGLQFALSSPQDTFWSQSWGYYFSITQPVGQSVPLLGRPCVTYKSLFRQIDTEEKVFNEDTWIYFWEKALNRKYRVTEISVVQSCPDRLSQVLRQFWRYGRSDFNSVSSLDERLALLFHSLVRIAVYRSFKIARVSGYRFSIFTILMGSVRTIAHLWTLISSPFRFTASDR